MTIMLGQPQTTKKTRLHDTQIDYIISLFILMILLGILSSDLPLTPVQAAIRKIEEVKALLAQPCLNCNSKSARVLPFPKLDGGPPTLMWTTFFILCCVSLLITIVLFFEMASSTDDEAGLIGGIVVAGTVSSVIGVARIIKEQDLNIDILIWFGNVWTCSVFVVIVFIMWCQGKMDMFMQIINRASLSSKPLDEERQPLVVHPSSSKGDHREKGSDPGVAS